MEKPDINSREAVARLVNAFYTKVRQDAVLGPFFNTTITDWEGHMETLTTFWMSSLFMKTRYTGNPIAVHVAVDKAFDHCISETHFGLWLNLWIETIDELYQGDYAEKAKRRARKMATFINLKVYEARKG